MRDWATSGGVLSDLAGGPEIGANPLIFSFPVARDGELLITLNNIERRERTRVSCELKRS